MGSTRSSGRGTLVNSNASTNGACIGSSGPVGAEEAPKLLLAAPPSPKAAAGKCGTIKAHPAP
jgi:hypothetical protein